MELHSKAETWSFDNDLPEFLHTHVIFQDANQYYHIFTHQREHEIDLGSISQNSELHQIPQEHIFPLFEPGLTKYDSPTRDDIYIKRPHLTLYDGSDYVSALICQEALVCETLKNNPHPKIARYFGCIEEEGRITGLCFEKYSETLTERRDRGVRIGEGLLKQVKAGAAHLHSLGLIHNDLRLDNIMFRELDKEAAVIIDFDSCVPVESPLPIKRGPVPDGVSVAIPENDHLGIENIHNFVNNC